MRFHATAYGLSTVLMAFTMLLGFSPAPVLSQPQIMVTSLPPYGSTQPLRGKIINIDPTTVQLATYLFKEGLGWFVKPTLASPCTAIQPDGQWEVNVATGFCDRWATKYALYLVPTDKSCPPAVGTSVPPPELDTLALSSIRVDRNPFLDNPLAFAGRSWVIKDSGNNACKVGPDLNIFAPQNVWVDQNGLHLGIMEDSGVWRTAEVWLNESLGFGEYRVLLEPLFNDLDPQAVFGAFTWDQEAPPHFRELDFELSRFGNPTDQHNAQFVVQPFTQVGNLFRFTIPLADLQAGLTSIQLWLPGEVTFSVYRGHHLGDPPQSDLIARWTKQGTAVPSPGTENFRFNLWLFNGLAPQGGQPQEVIVSDFAFTPSSPLGRGSGWVYIVGGGEYAYTLDSAAWTFILRDPSAGPWAYDFTAGQWSNALVDGWNYVLPISSGSYFYYNTNTTAWYFLSLTPGQLWYFNFATSSWGTLY